MSVIDVFVAGADDDAGRVKQLHGELRAAGLRPWAAACDLRAGDLRDTAIPQALGAARAFALVVTERWPPVIGAANAALWYQQDEVALAIDLAKTQGRSMRLVPVFFGDAGRERLPFGLRRPVAVRYDEGGVEALVAAVKPAADGAIAAAMRARAVVVDKKALRLRLAELYTHPDDARRVLGDAGFRVMRFDFAGPIERVWGNALDEVMKHDDGVERLQRAVEQDEYAL